MKHHPNADFADVPDGSGFSVSQNLHAFRVPKARFRKGNTYALSRPNGVLLVDATHAVTIDAVLRHLDGRRVLALLITHSDLLGQALGPAALLSRRYGGAPVLAHSADTHGDGDITPLEQAGELLGELGVRYYHIPGHTPGSVLYHLAPENLLFAGDGVVGRPYGSNTRERGPSHAPIREADWARYVEGWAAVPPPVAAVLPLHGEMLFGPASLAEAREAATRRGNLMRV